MSSNSLGAASYFLMGLAFVPGTCGVLKSQEASQANQPMSAAELHALQAGDSVVLSGRLQTADSNGTGQLYGCIQKRHKSNDDQGNIDQRWLAESYLEPKDLHLHVGTTAVDLRMPQECANLEEAEAAGDQRWLVYRADAVITVMGSVQSLGTEGGGLQIDVDTHHAGEPEALSDDLKSEATVLYIWAVMFLGLGLFTAFVGRGPAIGSGVGPVRRPRLAPLQVRTEEQGWQLSCAQQLTVSVQPKSCWGSVVGVALACLLIFPIEAILSVFDVSQGWQAKITMGTILLCWVLLAIRHIRNGSGSRVQRGHWTMSRDGLTLEMAGLGGSMLSSGSGGLRPQSLQRRWELWRPEVLREFAYVLKEDPGFGSVLFIEKEMSRLLETRDRVDVWFGGMSLTPDGQNQVRDYLDALLAEARERVGEGDEEVPEALLEQIERD